MKCRATAAVLACLLAAPAWSQERGVYLGVSGGSVEHRRGCEGITVPCDQSTSSGKFFVGYQFNRYFAAELGYADLGETAADGPVPSAIPGRQGGFSASAEVRAWELAGLGSLPVIGPFSLYGRLGLYYAETEFAETQLIPTFPMNMLLTRSTSRRASNSGLTFGAGARLDFGRYFSLRVEWQRYQDVEAARAGKTDIDSVALTLLFRIEAYARSM